MQSHASDCKCVTMAEQSEQRLSLFSKASRLIVGKVFWLIARIFDTSRVVCKCSIHFLELYTRRMFLCKAKVPAESVAFAVVNWAFGLTGVSNMVAEHADKQVLHPC